MTSSLAGRRPWTWGGERTEKERDRGGRWIENSGKFFWIRPWKLQTPAWPLCRQSTYFPKTKLPFICKKPPRIPKIYVCFVRKSWWTRLRFLFKNVCKWWGTECRKLQTPAWPLCQARPTTFPKRNPLGFVKNLRGISKSECVLLENLGEPDFEKRAYPEKLSGIADNLHPSMRHSKIRFLSGGVMTSTGFLIGKVGGLGWQSGQTIVFSFDRSVPEFPIRFA